ncbi:hypothetical protein Scep_004503 [Stephania cephalantha]|uniref:Uncharacterized protein n=1 Tax=Stephania cephalantha TaxID=152367 RepID=A0AAP0PXC9_9MAGN
MLYNFAERNQAKNGCQELAENRLRQLDWFYHNLIVILRSNSKKMYMNMIDRPVGGKSASKPAGGEQRPRRVYNWLAGGMPAADGDGFEGNVVQGFLSKSLSFILAYYSYLIRYLFRHGEPIDFNELYKFFFIMTILQNDSNVAPGLALWGQVGHYGIVISAMYGRLLECGVMDVV